MLDCLLNDDDISATSLSDALDRPDATELRLLRGAVTYLAPALCADPVNRQVLADLLLTVLETRGDYDGFMEDAEVPDGGDSMGTESRWSGQDSGSNDDDYTKQAMVLDLPQQAFTLQQYTNMWLLIGARNHARCVASRNFASATGCDCYNPYQKKMEHQVLLNGLRYCNAGLPLNCIVVVCMSVPCKILILPRSHASLRLADDWRWACCGLRLYKNDLPQNEH